MQAIYSALYAIVSTGLWKSTDGYLRINLCSRAFNEANVTNSGRYLISPVFGQKQGCRVEFLMGLQDRNDHVTHANSYLVQTKLSFYIISVCLKVIGL